MLAPGDFEPPEAYAVGGSPAGVAVVDLDGDGALDVVAAVPELDFVVFLAGDGAGGLGAAVPLALGAGAAPVAVAGGSFAGGARAAALGADGEVFLLDAGGLQSTVPAPVGLSGAADLAAGDLDGAGGDDLVLLFEGELLAGGGGLAVLLDDGIAPLAAVPLPAPPGGFERPRRLVLLDPDGDGDLDLAATRGGGLFAPPGVAGVLLYENDGAGGLSYAGLLAASAEPLGIAAADLDGDGHDDLVFAVASVPSGSPAELWTHLHDGSASVAPAAFAAQAPSPLGHYAVDLVAADLGDDGLPGFFVDFDVAAADFGSSAVGLHLSFDPLAGAFPDVAIEALGGVPVALAVGDLSGDGTPDLAVADAAGGAVQIRLAVPRAVAQVFGSGCAGTGGTEPEIAIAGAPELGASFAVELSAARPLAPALLGIAAAQQTTLLGGGCANLLAPPIPLLPSATDVSGAASVSFAVPAAAAPFAGLDLFFQWLVFDPFGTFLGAYALSDAARVQIGVP